MEWMLSARGGKLCIVDKYTFRKSKETNAGTSYRCTKNGCQAWISIDKTETILLKAVGKHNHPVSKKLEVQRLKNLVKQKVQENMTEKPMEIMNISIEQEAGNLNLTKQDIANIRKSIYRKRRRILETIPNDANSNEAKDVPEDTIGDDFEANISPENSLDLCDNIKTEEGFDSDINDQDIEDGEASPNPMDVTINEAEDCQRRWSVIRNRYAKEKRLASDVNSVQPKNTWPCMPALSFMANVVKSRKSFGMISSNFLPEDKSAQFRRNEETSTTSYSGEETGVEKTWIKTESPDPDPEMIEIDESGCGSSLSVSSNPSSYVSVRKMSCDFKECINGETTSGATVCFNNNNNSKTESATEELDSDYNFCLSLHKSLKEINKKYNMKTKIEILQVIDKYQNME